MGISTTKPNRSAGAGAATLPACPVVVIAASAGGLKPLSAVIASLPADFPAAVAVALHRAVQQPNLLVELLGKHAALTVTAAREGEPLEAGTAYVCPAGTHMTAEAAVRLFHGPKLNHVRPSADLMFVSLARTCGRRAVGVVLSGTGTDGAIGSKAIVDAGGTVVAQDPATADYPDMPAAAVALGPAQFVLPPEEIGAALVGVLERWETGATKVLLADDHRIVLDGLRALLGGQRDLDVLPRDAEDGRAAVRLSAELAPDVVIMDLSMPGLDGVSATRQIVARSPAPKVIALSAHTDSRTTERALRAGASAVLSKQKAFHELPAAIRAVMAGHVYVSRRGLAATET